MSGAELATKADLLDLKAHLSRDIGEVKAGLSREIASLRADMAAMDGRLNSTIELLRRDMTIKLGSMLLVAVGVLLAAMRYMPPHL